MSRSYVNQVDIMRGIAILGVLATHATSFTVIEMTSSSLYPLYIVFNKLGKLGTPTFIFLSSFVLFYNYYYKPLDKNRVHNFYRRRFVYILTPYIFWSVVYHFVVLTGIHFFMEEQASFSINKFVMDLLFGQAYTHLYFVIINVQFYLIFPAFLYFMQKKGRLTKHIFWAGWILQWVFVLSNHFWWEFPYKGSMALSYLSNYTLGALAGIYYEEIVKWLNSFRLSLKKITVPLWGPVAIIWAITGLWHIVLYYYGYVHNEWVNSLWYELAYNLYTLVSVVVLYYAATVIYKRGGKRIKQILTELGLVSFGIYLIHPLFLLCWRQLFSFSGSPVLHHLSIAGGYIVALLASWVVVNTVQKHISFSKLIFGPERRS